MAPSSVYKMVHDRSSQEIYTIHLCINWVTVQAITLILIPGHDSTISPVRKIRVNWSIRCLSQDDQGRLLLKSAEMFLKPPG